LEEKKLIDWLKKNRLEPDKAKEMLQSIRNQKSPEYHGQERLEKLLSREGLTKQEAINYLRQIRRPQRKINLYEHPWNPTRVKIGIISDTHIGSKFFNYRAFEESIKSFDREKVEAIYHAGDVIEGMSHREGHIYELEAIGTTAQIDLACQLLSRYKQPLYFTTGNHDEWAKKKSDQGVLVGPEIESRLSNAHFLGEYTANIRLHPKVNLRLTHEGSVAYALSYSLQKRVNALEGGTKPELLVNGHLHKAIYMYYRNIHCFEGATLLNQTPFMAMKGSPAHVGYWILDIAMDKGGVRELNQKFFPFY
jgi:predicted phosphodiesterase